MAESLIVVVVVVVGVLVVVRVTEAELPAECKYFKILVEGATGKNRPLNEGHNEKIYELHGVQWSIFAGRRQKEGTEMLLAVATSNPY